MSATLRIGRDEWEEEEAHPQPLTREGSSYPSHDAWDE